MLLNSANLPGDAYVLHDAVGLDLLLGVDGLLNADARDDAISVNACVNADVWVGFPVLAPENIGTDGASSRLL